MPDDSYWYATGDLRKVSITAPPGWQVPAQLELLDAAGQPVSLRRITAGLWCGTGPGEKAPGCRSLDCHTQVLGECQCGRHRPPNSPRITPAPNPAAGRPSPLAPSSLASQMNL